MKIEELFNRQNIVDMSFFNFNNAVTAAYFADEDLRILKVNENFKAFFPVLENVSNAYFPDVLQQLGVDEEQIKTFSRELAETGHVLIPKIVIGLDCGGTIDKFIGDAILIFFGDPESDGDREDAIKCAQMALRIQARTVELQETWKAHGISKTLRVRMGISTVYCTVGNFGSDQRLEYTAFGSAVNLAARLEESTPAGTILISESTYLLIQDMAECQAMGNVTPKEFVRPIGTYRLDALKDEGKQIVSEIMLTRVRKHVEVNLVEGSEIREVILELKEIQEEFEEELRSPSTE